MRENENEHENWRADVLYGLLMLTPLTLATALFFRFPWPWILTAVVLCFVDAVADMVLRGRTGLTGLTAAVVAMCLWFAWGAL